MILLTRYRNILDRYLLRKRYSDISFWHEIPEINESMNFKNPATGYYMKFYGKSTYNAFFDEKGVMMLNYFGNTGLQYNPLAISQYALGLYNRFIENKADEMLNKFLIQCDWLVENLEKNEKGVYVWKYKFDWYYRGSFIKSPWYSGVSQGSAISALIRAFLITKDDKYLISANKAIRSFEKDIQDGGVSFTDSEGLLWIEEIPSVFPPSHVLNGFIWALWGIYDYYLVVNDKKSKEIFDRAIETLVRNIEKYDTGYWSLYELSKDGPDLVASLYYHSLHIVQLRVLYEMTSIKKFYNIANKWDEYAHKSINRFKAFSKRLMLKLLYY